MTGSDKVEAPVLGFSKGQRLACAICGAEIEVISPCSCDPPRQSFVCCGEEMAPEGSRGVNLGVE